MFVDKVIGSLSKDYKNKQEFIAMTALVERLEFLVAENIRLKGDMGLDLHIDSFLKGPRRHRISGDYVYPENYNYLVETMTIDIHKNGSIRAERDTKGLIKDKLVKLDYKPYKKNFRDTRWGTFHSYNYMVSLYKDGILRHYFLPVCIMLRLIDEAERFLLKSSIQPPQEYTIVLKYDLLTNTFKVSGNTR